MKGFLPICIEGAEVSSTVISYVKKIPAHFFFFIMCMKGPIHSRV